MGLQFSNVWFYLPPHVLRAAPEGEHVVAVREARHGRRAGFGRGSSRAREAASSPVGLPAAAAAAATGERDSTANGLPVERRSGAAGGAWGAALALRCCEMPLF